MIKAVVFDLDDTLVPEQKYIESGYRHVAKVMSVKLMNTDKEAIYGLLMKLLAESSKQVFNRMLRCYGLEDDNETVMELVKQYREHEPDKDIYRAYTDATIVMESLSQKACKLGIITDGYSVSQKKKLKALGFSGNSTDKQEILLAKVIVTDDLGREFWKPHPKAFEIMQEALGVPFEQMAYVGDNPQKDFFISSCYPIQTVRIMRAGGVYENDVYFKGIKEKIRITSLYELLDVFEI